MKSIYQSFRDTISMDSQIRQLRTLFEEVEDMRASNSQHSLADLLMSGYAMFALKHPSLLSFEQQNQVERQNLENVYGIHTLCSDAQLRKVLDGVDPSFIRGYLAKQFANLEKAGLIEEYKYKIAGQKYLIVSNDGVQHFSSKKNCCDKCLRKTHRDGSTTYHHNMLCCALVHPEKGEVFILDSEPIVNSDGSEKNDCERNAAKRLLAHFGKAYREHLDGHRFLMVEDALYANCPHIEELIGNGMDYIINVKPDSHKTVFQQVESRRRRGLVRSFEQKDNGLLHHFEYANNIRLASSGEVRANFLSYTQTDKKGKRTTFTWVSSLKISKSNAFALMRAARARWRIENETFNTLKNLGYHFEHNFGHGKDHLSTSFAYLMLLAFWTDQFVQAVYRPFQILQQGLKTKLKLWESIKAVFHTCVVESMLKIYQKIAHLFNIPMSGYG